MGDRDIPAYVDEDGVTPEHGTETFAELTLELESWRWTGTNFRLRTGKAMGGDRKEVVVNFRPTPGLPFENSQGSVPNRLRFELEPEGLIAARAARLWPDPARCAVRQQCPVDPRRRAEHAWQIVEPVLEGWSRNVAPLEEYDAGSSGPDFWP